MRESNANEPDHKPWKPIAVTGESVPTVLQALMQAKAARREAQEASLKSSASADAARRIDDFEARTAGRR